MFDNKEFEGFIKVDPEEFFQGSSIKKWRIVGHNVIVHLKSEDYFIIGLIHDKRIYVRLKKLKIKDVDLAVTTSTMNNEFVIDSLQAFKNSNNYAYKGFAIYAVKLKHAKKYFEVIKELRLLIKDIKDKEENKKKLFTNNSPEKIRMGLAQIEQKIQKSKKELQEKEHEVYKFINLNATILGTIKQIINLKEFGRILENTKRNNKINSIKEMVRRTEKTLHAKFDKDAMEELEINLEKLRNTA